MGRPERPLDPEAGPVERLAWELRRLRNEAGRPSYRELARRAHFSRSTLAEVATGLRLPTLEATVAYAVACGGARDEWDKRWREASDELEQSQRRCPYPGLAPLQADEADLFFGRSTLTEELLAAVRRAPLTAVFGASGSGKSSLLLAGLLPALAAAGTPAVLMTPGAHPREALAAALTGGSDAPAVVVIDQFEEAFTLCADHGERGAFLDALTELIRSGDPRPALVLGVRSDFYGHCAQHRGLVEALRDNVQLPIGPMSEEELREIITAPAGQVGIEVDAELVATVIAEAAGQPGALPLVAHALRETWHRRPGQTLTLGGYRATGGVREAVAQTAERLYADLDGSGREIVRAVLLRLTALGDGTEDTRRRLHRDELTGLGEPGEVDAVIDLLAAHRLVVADGDTMDVAHEALIRAWPRLQGWLADDREALRDHHRLTTAAVEWDGNDRHDEFLYRGNRLAAWDDHPRARLNELERDFLAAGRSRETARRRAARKRVRLGFGGLGLTAAVVSVLAVVAMVQAGRAADGRDRAFSRQLAAQARLQLHVDPELALLLAIKAYEAEPTEDADIVLRQATLDSRLRRILPTGVSGVVGMTSASDRRRVALWDTLGRLQIWKWGSAGLAREHLIFPPERTSYGIMSTAFSPDGRYLATGTTAGAVQVWDLAAGPAGVVSRPRTRHAGKGQGQVAGVAFGPDGRLAGTHGDDVWIWDLNGRRKRDVLSVPRASGVALSADGSRLAASGITSPLRIWDVSGPDAKLLGSSQEGRGHEHLIFSPDGRWLSSTSLGEMKIWPVPARPGRWQPHSVPRDQTAPPNGVAFSGDGRRIASHHIDQSIVIRTTGGDRNSLVLRAPGDRALERIAGVAFGPDGRTLASAGFGGTIRLWDVSTSDVAEGAHLSGFPDDASIAALSDDGGTVAGLPVNGGAVRIWNTARGGKPITVPARENINVALSPGGRWIAGGSHRDGALRLLDLRGGGPPIVLGSDRRSVSRLAFSADGRLLASAGVSSGDGEGLRVWRIPEHGAPTPVLGWDKVLDRGTAEGGLALSPDGRRLAAARADRTVAVWDLTGKAPPRILRGHVSTVRAVTFSRDGNMLAGVGEDGTTRLWRTSGRYEPTAVLRGEPSLVRTAVFTPDGAWLATTEPDGGLRLWRASGRGEPLTVRGFGSSVARLAFSPNGARLTVALDRTVSGDGRWLNAGLGDNRVRIWQCEVCGPGPQVLELARRRAMRNLTAEEHRLFLGTSKG